MTVAVFTKGGASASNKDVPTNCKITANNTYSTSGTRLFTAIHTDASEAGSSTSHTYEITSGANERSNLATTKGYRIKTYQTSTQTGYQFNPSDWDDTNKKFDNFDYFVLVYSDDHLQHHFAKITEVIKEDVLGDAFEFTPKLGNEIPKDTKFMIFKGPPQNSNVVAFSAGIKKDLQNELICASPLFYFYDESLDKKGELDHNKKYFIRQHGISSGTTVTMYGNADDATFLTTQEYLGEIIDYSRYSMKLSITDNLRVLDIDGSGSNEGETITGYGTNTDYGNVFVNARRDTDDEFDDDYNGEYRYLTYSYSPNCTNIVANVIKHSTHQSFNNIAGHSETTIVDTFRISNVKLKENDFYGVRHRVHVAETQEWKTIDCNIESLTLSGGYRVVTVNVSDINSYLVAGNEVKIGDNICIVRSITTTTITLENYYRISTEGVFTSGTPTLTTDDVIYRRAFNHLNSTLLTDFKIIEGREKDLYVRFDSHNFALLEAKVSSSNKNRNLLTLSEEFDSYDSAPLSYLQGSYSIEINRFEGEIETINTYKENGQTYVDISGRDTFNKILSPIINKETVFSEDIIYSSETPYSELKPVETGGGTHIELSLATFDSSDIQLSNNIVVVAENADPSSAEVDNKTHLFAKLNQHICYVGRVSASSGSVSAGSDLGLSENSFVELLSSDTALLYYTRLDKKFIFNKALGANASVDSSSDLRGASDKGVLFTGGFKINGAEEDYLPNTSSNTTNALARGYYISNVQNIKNDSYFFANLGNDATPESYEDFDVVNSLLDFTVVSVKDNGAIKEVEIAPHNPLLLARKDINYANAILDELTSTDRLGVSIGNVTSGLSLGRTYIIMSNNSLSNNNANRYAHHGDAIYYNGSFVGIIDVSYPESSGTVCYLQAPSLIEIGVGETVTIINKTTEGDYEELAKKSHEFSIINGGILHGGKFISLLSPFGGDIPHTMDYMTFMTTSTERVSYKERFGSPTYRIFNVEKGNITRKNHNAYSNEKVLNFYNNKISRINYYGSAYKHESGFLYSGGTYYDNLLGVNRITSAIPNPEIEVRGITSVMGSKFFDANILPSGQNPVIIPYEKQNTLLGSSTILGYNSGSTGNIRPSLDINRTKAMLNIRDTTADRMFIYSISDLRPYSRFVERTIMNPTYDRSVEKYGILSMNSPQINNTAETKDNDGVVTNRVVYQDKDYKMASILESDKAINSLKMFSLMRLTEVVVDFGFNPINIEQIQSKKIVIPPVEMTYGKLEANIDGTNTLTLVDGGSNDYSGNNLSVNTDYTTGSNPLIIGDILTTSNGLVIGEVTAVTSTTISLRKTASASAGYNLTEQGAKYYGQVYALKLKDIVNSPTIKGTGSSDTIGQVGKGISLSKTISSSFLSTALSRKTLNINFNWSKWTGVSGMNNGYIQLIVPNSSGVAQTYNFDFNPDTSNVSSLPSGTNKRIDVGSFDWLNKENMNERFLRLFLKAIKETDFLDYAYISKQGPSFISFTCRHNDSSSVVVCSANVTSGTNNFNDKTKCSVDTSVNIFEDGYGGSDSGSDSIFENSGTSAKHTSFGSRLGGSITSNRLLRSLFPFFTTWGYNGGVGSFTVSNFENGTDRHCSSHLFKQLFMCNEVGDDAYGSLTHDNELFMNNFLPIVLGTFRAEETSGQILDYGTVSPEIKGISRVEFTTNDEIMSFGISHAGMGTLLSNALGDINDDAESSGVQLGFKPRLEMDDAQTNAYHVTNYPSGYHTSRAVGGEDVYHYTIDSATGTNGATNNGNKYKWLELLDLTGCYLASYEGYYTDNSDDSVLLSKKHDHSLNNVMPYKLIYVISHEIDTTNTGIRHILTTDEKLDTDIYAILQPNHVCFYENSHKNINLNMLSSSYTINPTTDKPFEDLRSFTVKDAISDVVQGDGESALSMYVIVDNNRLHYDDLNSVAGPYSHTQRKQKHLVVRDVQEYASNKTKLDDILSDLPQSMVFSDGDNFLKTAINYTLIDDSTYVRHKLTLSSMEELKGIVSVSESITLQVTNSFDSNAKRCLIGSTVNICNETNDLINNLLEDEGIDFNITSEDDYPLFVSPDIRGKSLLDSLNLILNKKDKNILYYDNKFIIRNKTNSDNYPQILISEDSDVNIYEYSKDKNMFDIYNEIIVYGANHRAIRRNIRSQNKIGRKTLEHFSDELITQEEVDSKATELLKIHSELSDTFNFTLGHHNISQIRAGDIVTVSLPRENIHTNQYIVLELQHTIDGLIKVKVGKYSKEIADRFIEILLENKKQTNYFKRKNFIDKTQNFTTIDTLNLNLIKMKIRKGAGSGFTLGFGTTLNTNSNQLGFTGGSLTYTNLLEEEY